MHNSKLVTLLKLLTYEEIRLLEKFVKSPYFNSHKHHHAFYLHLKKYYPDFSSSKLDREKTYKKLFPDRAYHYKKMSNLMSSFTHLVEEFIYQLQLKSEPAERQKKLLYAYRDRGNKAFYAKNAEELMAQILHPALATSGIHLELFLLSRDMLAQQSVDGVYADKKSYNALMKHLDLFFTIEKLRLSSELKARERLAKEEYDIWLLDAILEKIDSPLLETDNPLPNLYKLVIQLFEDTSGTTYFKLKSRFFEHQSSIEEPEKRFIFQQLLNYAVRKGNAGSDQFKNENLLLYKSGLDLGLLLNSKGQMADSSFTNIAYLAAMLGDSSWCHSFINKYASMLADAVRNDAVSLCTAYLHYQQKELHRASVILLYQQFSGVLYQYRAKYLLLRVYYEMLDFNESYFDLFMAHNTAFEKYLRRDKLAANARTAAYLEFTLLLRKISKYRIEGDIKPYTLSRLKKRLDNHPYIVGKSWLKEQVNQLKTT